MRRGHHCSLWRLWFIVVDNPHILGCCPPGWRRQSIKKIRCHIDHVKRPLSIEPPYKQAAFVAETVVTVVEIVAAAFDAFREDLGDAPMILTLSGSEPEQASTRVVPCQKCVTDCHHDILS